MNLCANNSSYLQKLLYHVSLYNNYKVKLHSYNNYTIISYKVKLYSYNNYV